MPRTLYALKVDICPKGSIVPIVTHVFYGDSKEHVESSLLGHMNDDDFLNECYNNGAFNGTEFSIVQKLVKKEL